ncbi:MAG: MBL fold metallo-hydrolase [Chlamydiota bacterium]
MYGFCPLASGSKGNCIYVGTKEAKILIDAGLSGRAIKERLALINVDLSEIDAILVTHEHIDHIRGLQVLGCRMGIPVFANGDTAKAIYDFLHECPKFKIFSTGETFEFGGMEIHPFSIQHDAIDPVAFTIKTSDLKLGFCADLGFATTLVSSQLQGCDYLYLESNHEVSMVHSCNRPMVYKQRVLSRQGHLSNEQCASLLQELHHANLKHVHLAHLSSECNAHEIALKSATTALNTAIPVSIALQDIPSTPIFF